jgi:restriction system protein
VLCEHGSGEGLRPHRLEELRDVMATHRIRRGQFATTSPVGTAVQALAAQYAINLLDIPHLLNTISKRKPAQQAELWELVRTV